jgi:transposase-like protein
MPPVTKGHSGQEATPWPPSAFWPKPWQVRTIRTLGSSTPTRTPAIVQLKAEGALEENCRHRPVQYLDNVLEQNHRAVKRRASASQYFRSFWAAWRTIAGYEAIHMIRKGQAC